MGQFTKLIQQLDCGVGIRDSPFRGDLFRAPIRNFIQGSYKTFVEAVNDEIGVYPHTNRLTFTKTSQDEVQVSNDVRSDTAGFNNELAFQTLWKAHRSDIR